MRKIILLGTVMVLTLLFAQAAYAVYDPAGPATVSTTTPAPGSTITISGDGFAVNSQVTITIHSEPIVLATVTTDATGAFSVEVTVPAGFSGSHEIVATGVAPDNSVRVLSTPITVGGFTSPNTSVSPSGVGGNPVLTGMFVLGTILVSASVLLYLRGRRIGA